MSVVRYHQHQHHVRVQVPRTADASPAHTASCSPHFVLHSRLPHPCPPVSHSSFRLPPASLDSKSVRGSLALALGAVAETGPRTHTPRLGHRILGLPASPGQPIQHVPDSRCPAAPSIGGSAARGGSQVNGRAHSASQGVSPRPPLDSNGRGHRKAGFRPPRGQGMVLTITGTEVLGVRRSIQRPQWPIRLPGRERGRHSSLVLSQDPGSLARGLLAPQCECRPFPAASM